MNLRNIPGALGLVARGGGRHRRRDAGADRACCRSRRASRQALGAVGLGGRRDHPALRLDQRDELGLRLRTRSRVISDAPGIKRDARRQADALRRAVRAHRRQAARARTRSDATCRCAACRPLAPQLRKSFKIDEGRMMREGTNEIIVGDGVVQQLRRTRGRQEGALGQRGLGQSSGASATTAASPNPKPGRDARAGAAGLEPRQELPVDARASSTTNPTRRSRSSRTR